MKFQWTFVNNVCKRHVSLSGGNRHVKSLVYAKKLDNTISNTHFISLSGPGTIDFVNGMVTTKLNEKVIKKNLTSLSMDDEGYEPSQTLTDLQDISMSNYVAKQMIDLYKTEFKTLDDEDIRRKSLYDEQLESYGNIKGQFTALLTSQSKVTSLMRLYTPLSEKGESIIIELPKQYDAQLDPECDAIAILEKHKRFKRHVKMVKDVQEEPESGFDVWELCFKGNLTKSDMELEVLSMILEENKMNYLFNKKIHVDEHFLSDKIIAIYFDDVLYNSSLVNEDSHNVYYRYKVLVEKSTTKFNDFVHSIYVENFKENSIKEIQDIEHKFGLFDLGDILPGSVLPFDLSLDYVPNSLSFDKGCYIGQELTTRMYSTDKIVKRGVPIDVLKSEKNLQPQVGWDLYTDYEFKTTDEEEPKVNDVFGSSKQGIKKRNKPVGKLIINNDEKNVRLVSLKIKYINEIFANKNKEIKFYLTPSKDEMKSKGLKKDDYKVDVEIKTPYWIDEYTEE